MNGLLQGTSFPNVVQIITNNATNHVVVGRMVMDRDHSIFWTPCAANSIELMLEDMAKLSFIKEKIDQARCIPKFIYNDAFILIFMRKCTINKELWCTAITCLATNFLTPIFPSMLM